MAIFGASGFIGRNLLALSSGRGHKVFPFYNGVGAGIFEYDAVPYDLAQKGAFHIPEPIDAVFYLAQSAHYRDFPAQADDIFAVNSLGPVRVAKAALEAGCRFFFYASSGNVYTPTFAPLAETSPACPHTPYAASKLMGEMAAGCFADSMTIVSGRIFGAYGPGQKAMLPWMLLQKIRKGEAVELAPAPDGKDGGLHISFIYITDLVERLLNLAELAIAGVELPSILNLGGPDAVAIKDFALAIGHTLGKSVKFVEAPKPRVFDLHADISLLDSLCPTSFTPMEQGVSMMCHIPCGFGV